MTGQPAAGSPFKSRAARISTLLVSAFTGSHPYVMDYLVEEVLKLQPEGMTITCCEAWILERLCDRFARPSSRQRGPRRGSGGDAEIPGRDEPLRRPAQR